MFYFLWLVARVRHLEAAQRAGEVPYQRDGRERFLLNLVLVLYYQVSFILFSFFSCGLLNIYWRAASRSGWRSGRSVLPIGRRLLLALVLVVLYYQLFCSGGLVA